MISEWDLIYFKIPYATASILKIKCKNIKQSLTKQCFHPMNVKNVICTNAWCQKNKQTKKKNIGYTSYLHIHTSALNNTTWTCTQKRINKIENMNGMKLLILNLEKVSLQEQKVPVSYNSKLDLVNVGNHSY